MNLDNLELELRKLPGVRWASFSELGDRLLVQLHAMEEPGGDLALEASRIAARHSDVPIAVDVVRWMAPPGSQRTEHERVKLRSNGSSAGAAMPARAAHPAPAPRPPMPPPAPLPDIVGVLTLADTDEVEVHLGDGTTRTVGRAPLSRGLIGAADATIDAIRDGFTVERPVETEWARRIDTTPGGWPLVAVAVTPTGRNECYGLSSADSEMEAAARATLDALHRNLRVARRADTS
jgi:hypothetical protein